MRKVKKFLKNYWKAYVEYYAPFFKYGVPIV